MKYFPILLSILISLPLSAGAVGLYGDTGVNVNVGADASAKSQTNAGATTSVNVGVSGSTHVETPSGVEITVDRSGTGGADVSVEHRITGDPDFDLMVTSATKDNARVSKVDVAESGSVDVAFKHDGRLFGVIPVKVTSHTMVAADENGNAKVVVKLPWWSFFVSGVSKVKGDIETALSSNSEVKASANAEASAAARVKLVEVIVSSLTAEANAQASASVETSTNSSY